MDKTNKTSGRNTGRGVGRRHPRTLLVGEQVGAVTVPSVQQFLRKLEVDQPQEPTGPLLLQRHMQPCS